MILLAARLAAGQMTRDELAAAEELVASRDENEALRYLRDAGLPVAVGGVHNVNRAFHRMVYCGSHNQVLIQYRELDLDFADVIFGQAPATSLA